MSRREPKGAECRLLDAKQAISASKLVQLVLPGTFIFPVEGCKQENSPPKTRKEEAASVGLARDPVEGYKH